MSSSDPRQQYSLQNADDIYSALLPIYYISKAVGLAPYKYVKKNLSAGPRVQLCTSKPAVMYSFFVAVMVPVTFLSSFVLKTIIEFPHHPVATIIPDIMLFTALNLTSTISVILAVTVNKEKVKQILIHMEEVDKVLLSDTTGYYKKTRSALTLKLVLILILISFVGLFDCIMWSFAVGMKNSVYWHIYVDAIIEWVVVCQFFQLILMIKDRYEMLNNCLYGLHKRITQETESDTTNPFQEKNNPVYILNISNSDNKLYQSNDNILTFNKVNELLCDTSLLIKSAYEYQIFLSIVSSFVGMTIWSYFGFCIFYGYQYSTESGIDTMYLVMADFLWFIVNLVKVVCITLPCHAANIEVAKTPTVLRKLLLIRDMGNSVLTELELFSNHVAMRQFKFSALGFLNLDLSLLCSMLGAVVTYLVVLMQFQMSGHSTYEKSFSNMTQTAVQNCSNDKIST